MARFLRYVVEKTLVDDLVALRERQIGIEVFERDLDWDPKLDNIVRTEARRLRSKLEAYAASNDPHETVRINMPTGGYGVQFEERSATAADKSDGALAKIHIQSLPRGDGAVPAEKVRSGIEDQTAEDFPAEASAISFEEAGWLAESNPRRGMLRLRSWPVYALFVLFVVVTAGTVWMVDTPRGVDRLWSVLFKSGGRTLVVVSDAGLNLYVDLSHRRIVSPQDYSSKSYLAAPEGQIAVAAGTPPLADRRYTTMSDVKLLTYLLHLPKKYSQQADVRFARSISAEDLKAGNAILIGAPNYNPWVQLFDKDTDFQMTYIGDEDVVNKIPQTGEPKIFTRIGNATSPDAPTILIGHALISLVSNPGHVGHVLLVEGKSMDNIEAASDFLFNSEAMKPIIEKAERQGGGLNNFDLVLETRYMRGGSLDAKLVALHVHSRP